MRLRQHLVVFAKWPMLGSAKRRLGKDIGAVQAVRFQRATLALMLRRLGGDQRWITWLAVTPDRSGPWPSRFRLLPQGQGDLGRRMAAVARKLPPGPVVIVGSDIPDIVAGDIAQAFRELGRRDAVFGPATDGGYWLVGMRRRPHFLDFFANVRWSTEHALADTLSNLIGKDVTLLRTLSDIDDGSSLRRYLRKKAQMDHGRGNHASSEADVVAV